MRLTKILCACLALPALAPAAEPAANPAAALPVYTVFVDPPTGFAFVKLPSGWKFVARVGAADLARLPPTVVTTLLPPEADAHLAAGAAGQPAALARQGR